VDCNNATLIPASGGTFTGTTSGSSFFTSLCGGGAAPEALFAWTPDSSEPRRSSRAARGRTSTPSSRCGAAAAPDRRSRATTTPP
jgi:hypothetical protein